MHFNPDSTWQRLSVQEMQLEIKQQSQIQSSLFKHKAATQGLCDSAQLALNKTSKI